MFGEAKLIAIGLLVAGLFMAYRGQLEGARQEGAAQCKAEHDAADVQQQRENDALRGRQDRRRDEIDAQQQREAQRLAALASARGADLDRVRGQLAAAVGPAAGAASSPAGCADIEQRLAVVGRLLGEGFGLAEEGRSGAERLAAQVTSLQDYATQVCQAR